MLDTAKQRIYFMRKKFTFILTVCILLALSLSIFVACDDNKENDEKAEEKLITLTVYEANVNPNEPTLVHQQKSGQRFTVSDYYYVLNGGQTIYGPILTLGFYYDTQCTQKVHRESVFDSDTNLYVLWITPGMETYMIDFVVDGDSYTLYQESKTALSVDDFAVSAYGKEIDRTKLQFFSDEEMTNQIDIVGKTYDDLNLEQTERFAPNWHFKTIYVKLS